MNTTIIVFLIGLVCLLAARLWVEYKSRPATLEEDKFKQIFRSILGDLFNATDTVFSKGLDQLRDIVDKTQRVEELEEKISSLTITKSQREEEFARREREIEHKVGLERNRQAQELDLERKRITVELEKAALDKDRTRFEEQMKFSQDRFEKEIIYQREIVERMVQRFTLTDKKITSIGG